MAASEAAQNNGKRSGSSVPRGLGGPRRHAVSGSCAPTIVDACVAASSPSTRCACAIGVVASGNPRAHGAARPCGFRRKRGWHRLAQRFCFAGFRPGRIPYIERRTPARRQAGVIAVDSRPRQGFPRAKLSASFCMRAACVAITAVGVRHARSAACRGWPAPGRTHRPPAACAARRV